MFGLKKQLIHRSLYTKGIAILMALIGIYVLTLYTPLDTFTKWGFFLWYATFGGIILMMGFLVNHPFFPKDKTLRSIIRGLFIGGWMNFVLYFFAYDTIEIVKNTFGFLEGQSGLVLIVLEGMLVGAVLDYLGTKYGGEGKELL